MSDTKPKSMNQLIGFATQFYTLWSVEKVQVYVTDSNGKHWLARVDDRYTYHKNISKSLDEVRRQYPTLTLDAELRGKTTSFDREGESQLPDYIFGKGKYAYQVIADVAKIDWEYVLWAHDVNMGNHASHIETLPQWAEHKAKLEFKAKQDKEAADAIRAILPIGQPIAIHGLSNGFNLEKNDSDAIVRVTFKAVVDGIDGDIWVHCSDAHRVLGMYPYIMPVVNGKAQKTKFKDITVTPTGLRVYENGNIAIWIDPLTSEYGPTITY